MTGETWLERVMSMTNQQAFDHVANHLREQGQAALSDGGICVLRNRSGLTCAVGCLIPMGRYEPRMEALVLDDLHDEITDLFSEWPVEVLATLQGLHDSTQNWEEHGGFVGEDSLLDCAEQHGLTYTPPKAAD